VDEINSNSSPVDPIEMAAHLQWGKNLRKIEKGKYLKAGLPSLPKDVSLMASLKIDGMRIYYPGNGRNVYSYGRGKTDKVKKYNFPKDWRLPQVPFEAEAWLANAAANGQQCNRESASARVKNESFKGIRLTIFDLPCCTLPYCERLELMQKLVVNKVEYVDIVESYGAIKGRAELDSLLEEKCSKGSEGLVLNYSNGRYHQSKRRQDAPGVMKCKPRIEMECKVHSNVDGSAVKVVDGNGCIFSTTINKLGCFCDKPHVAEENRGKRIKVGKMVVVYHEGKKQMLSNSKGYTYDNPEIVEYTDRSWEDTQAEWIDEDAPDPKDATAARGESKTPKKKDSLAKKKKIEEGDTVLINTGKKKIKFISIVG
jgi:hypothetical protein